MSGNAKIGSIEKLKEFRARMLLAKDSISAALCEASADIQRIKVWLSQEQKSYWQGVYRKRQEQFQLAKRNLANKKNETTMLGNRRSCIDEEKAYQKAKRLIEEAELKLKNIHRWSSIIDKEIYNYKSLVQPITNMTEDDIPKAAALLEAMVISLEKYADYYTDTTESVARNGQEEETPDNQPEQDGEQ